MGFRRWYKRLRVTVGYRKLQVVLYACVSVTMDYRLLPWVTRYTFVRYRLLPWITVGYCRGLPIINVCLQRWIWVGNIDNVVWVTVDSGGNSV